MIQLVKQTLTEMKKNHMDNKDKVTQESLQPKRIAKDEKAYQSVLDIEERLQKGDATNIALTGPYGSGKSSILITLKEDFPEHHYLNVSLATLKPSESIAFKNQIATAGENGDELTKLNLDRLIEYSILQQLIYKERQEVLPNSRFKRIFHLPNKKISRVTWAVFAAIIAIVILFEPTFMRVEWLCHLFGKEWMNIAGDTVSGIYLLWFVFRAIMIAVPVISNSRLNKLNLKDGEIEIVENTSIFNKHLDEILYFFEQTDYDVVMLEDLDRFETTDIFLKLRELNLLLNESKVVGRKIFFIYAVRDDMFQDAERVKCFDYVTTVIPVINRSNAKSQLKEELEKRGVTEISDYHLQELGFFLYDMRLLKNIANEYVQYRGKISQGVSSAKLLGMIVYKNYYPKDFADLHECKGVVYQLLNLKETLVSAKIEEIEAQNQKMREQQEQYEKERHLKETELRRIYLDAYRDQMIATMQHLKLGDNSYSIKDVAANEKLFDKLTSSSSVRYTYIDTSYYNNQTRQTTLDINFSQIEQTVDSTQTYKQRLEVLRYTFDELEDADFVDIRKEDIRSQTLSQIMNEVDYATNPSYIELKVPRLIEFLVVKGYIDENYYDYISYFYGNFIDAHDWDFVLDLKLNKTHPYDYHIKNAEACIKEIPNAVFRKPAILNVELLDYLAAHSSDRMNMSRLLVVLRTTIDGKRYDFLSEYYLKGQQQDVVFAQLFSLHKNLWDAFDKNDDEKQSLKLIWFKYAEKEQSCDGSKKWLNSHFDFVTNHLLDINDEQWCMLISQDEYEFGELNGTSSNILKAVAEMNAYSLTRHNVEVLVSCLLDMNLEAVSYRLVCETEHETLIDRVEENLGQCMKTVFASPEAEKESEDAILGILLSSQATEDEKINYLHKQQNKINLEQAEQKDVKTLALKCDVVETNWDTVIHYLNNVSEQKTDETLTSFVERHVDELAIINVPAESKEDEQMLLREYVASDTLALSSYEKLLVRFKKWYYSNVPIIQEKRVSLMISMGMVRFTDDNTKNIQENYSDKTVADYLLRNKKDFLEKKETVNYTTELASALLKSAMTEHEKASIIPLFRKTILNEDVGNQIVLVLKVVQITLDSEFLIKVLSLSRMTNEKILVINYTLEKNDLSEEIISNMLCTLPEPYSSIADKGKKPEIPDTYQTRRLAETLKKRNYISSYSETKKGIRVNTKLK